LIGNGFSGSCSHVGCKEISADFQGHAVMWVAKKYLQIFRIMQACGLQRNIYRFSGSCSHVGCKEISADFQGHAVMWVAKKYLQISIYSWGEDLWSNG
jgi:Rieske Fe-S protein